MTDNSNDLATLVASLVADLEAGEEGYDLTLSKLEDGSLKLTLGYGDSFATYDEWVGATPKELFDEIRDV